MRYLRFRMNTESGKKDLVIELEGDEELMRHEHEAQHRQLVERLVGEGLIDAEDVGQVRVERVAPSLPREQAEPPLPEPPAAEANPS